MTQTQITLTLDVHGDDALAVLAASHQMGESVQAIASEKGVQLEVRLQTPYQHKPRPQTNNPIGKRLKELREEKGLSQKELGQRSGVPRTRISACERGIRQLTEDELRPLGDELGAGDELVRMLLGE